MKDEPMKNELKKTLLLICLSFIGSSFIAFSLYASTKDDLEQTKKEMAAARDKQVQIEAQSRRVWQELGAIQSRLVTVARAIQKAETDMAATEEKLGILSVQLEQKRTQFAARKKHLASLVSVALRLSRVPPEMAVVAPDDDMKTMRASTALKMASDDMKKEIAAIQLQLAELEKLEQKVRNHRDKLVKQKEDLTKQREGLKEQVAQRKALWDQFNLKEQQQAEAIAKLARKATDLEELVQKLDQGTRARGLLPEGQKGKLRSFAKAKGHVRLPATGKIIKVYGDTQGKDQTSKGISLQTNPATQVVAPFDGEVVFTGTFMAYGRMVILRHSDDFHTLIAGLSKIDTSAGEFLLEGEPIGAMGNKELDSRLYFELRKNNQPVDPAPWLNL